MILLVEDDVAICDLVAGILESAGYEVSVAHSAQTEPASVRSDRHPATHASASSERLSLCEIVRNKVLRMQ